MAVSGAMTFLLPVRDAESTLEATVTRVLEAASDLYERFNLLIIDDGSTDATDEMARELSRHYPQIRTLRLNEPQGEEGALRAGYAESRGDVVCVRGLCRPTFERLSWASGPARPNFLGRARNLVREGQ
jgi:hypothetical protein